jgi:hypothetical protein
MSRINPTTQIREGSAANQLLVTDSGLELVFINPPTTSGQSLIFSAGTLTWSTIAGTSYIGDATTHTSGGNLNMNSFNITNIGNAIVESLTFFDTGGDMASWSIAEESLNELEFTYNGSTKLTLLSTGQMVLNTYGSGTYTGTPVYYLCVDASGNIIELAI